MFATDAEANAAWLRLKAQQALSEALARCGYPARHIERLAGMYGPSLECAKELLPKAMSDGIAWLIGERGPGKTQIATWLAAQRHLAGAGCGLYRVTIDAWQEIRATWSKDGKSEDEVFRRYKRAAFLVLDEVQDRGDTDNERQWGDRMLSLIIDHRYGAQLPTVCIANLTPAAYEQSIPPSIRSRVSESGGVKVCNWPSYRK